MDQKTAEESVIKTSIPGLLKIVRKTFTDDRGFLREVFHLDEVQNISGIDFKPVQWNHSLSKPGVLRGLHIEPWNKLVYPVTGQMFAAIADLRPDSPTFAKVETFAFGGENELYALFIAEGLANSVCVVGDQPVNYLYLVDAYYSGMVKAFAYNDPDLNIVWPIKNPIISQRDRENITLRQAFPEKFK